MSFGSFVLLPNITGAIELGFIQSAKHSGAIDIKQLSGVVNLQQNGDVNTAYCRVTTDASKVNALYKETNQVQPKSLVFNYVVKY